MSSRKTDIGNFMDCYTTKKCFVCDGFDWVPVCYEMKVGEMSSKEPGTVQFEGVKHSLEFGCLNCGAKYTIKVARD